MERIRLQARARGAKSPKPRACHENRTITFRAHLEVLEDRCLLSITTASSIVATGQLFYANSAFADPGYNPSFSKDTAIAAEKTPLWPGSGSSTFASVSSYAQGINGIMVDLPAGIGAHASLNATDFTFRTSGPLASNSPNTWAVLNTVPTVSVRMGQAPAGGDRVELVWPDSTIVDTWLQVTVLADAHTGLATDQRFYFGSLPGDSGQGNDPNAAFTDATDEIAARNHQETDLSLNHPLSLAISNPYDYNRDDQVDATDQIYARNFASTSGELDMINIGALSPPTISAALANDTGPSGVNNSDSITQDPTVVGVLSGANPIASFHVSLNSGPALEKASLLQANGSYTIDLTVLATLNGGNALADGSYTLHLRGIDSQCVGCYTEVAFTLKRSIGAPQLPDLVTQSDTGSSNTDNITKINTPTISVTGEAGSLITLLVDGHSVDQAIANPSTQFTLSTLTDATHVIRARAQDGAGNSALSPNLSVTISTASPVVTATTLATVSADVTPHVSVTASDPLGLPDGTQVNLDVDLDLDGDFADSGERSRTLSTLFGGKSYFQLTPALPPTDPISGPYLVQWRARVTDVAGNIGVSLLQTLEIDTLANNVLKNYVQMPDASYGWSLNSTLTGTGYTSYVLDLKSQTWLTTADVNLPLWRHWVQVIVPTGAINSTALMYIHGGSNTNAAPTSTDASLVGYALQSHSVIVDLPMVPSEPLIFTGDPGTSRSEDAIIAYTFNQYMTHLGQAGNENWPALLPMVKSAVKAMDATQAFVPTKVAGGHVDDFVITGYSKRGWTTWLTAAVDNRVKAIIPGVFDNLNTGEQMIHHYGFYGFFAPSLNDYTAFNIPQNSYTTNGLSLGPVIDPYRYLTNGRFDTMPKLMINSAGDEYFVPDSAQFYFSDLPGTKNYIRYIPNVGHGLNSVDPVNSTASFYDAVINNRPLPQFSWTVQQDGSIRVQTVDTPTNVVMWEATNPAGRDFRWSVTGTMYFSSPLTDQGGGVYIANAPTPASGATAFFIQMTFPSAIAGNPYIFTTQIKVVSSTPLVSWPFYMPTFALSSQAVAGAIDLGAITSGLAAPLVSKGNQPPMVALALVSSPNKVDAKSASDSHRMEDQWTWFEDDQETVFGELTDSEATDRVFAQAGDDLDF